MAKAIQISAPISKATKDLLEKHVKASGTKKGHLVESALLYHLRALHELPSDILVPARVVVTRESFEKIADQLQSPSQPTADLKSLLRSDGD